MAETNYDTLFGRIAVEQGLCTKEELRQSLKKHQALPKDNPVALRDVMIKLGYITAGQAARLKTNIKESKTAAQKIPGYQILGKIGAGAMAIVYKARQLSLNRIVAIKILPKRFSENQEYVERFYKEGQAAGKLNHNNIVQAVDVGEAGGYHYFVMEMVEGKTLYDDLSKGKVFGEQEAIDVIIQVAKALRHAHGQVLIHRDVKPKNIMINQEGVVKLADMGLARETTDIEAAKTEKGKAYGTPYYIAPEQIRGEMDIDERADIYGLGATFYHLVTGRVPFMADDPVEVMKRHLRDELVPPDHINTALSAGVSEVIEVMMAKNKNDRYRNVDELLIDLEAVRDGQTPMRAHKRFDVSVLEQLEEGNAIGADRTDELEEAVTKYKTWAILLGIASAVMLLVIIMMFVKGK